MNNIKKDGEAAMGENVKGGGKVQRGPDRRTNTLRVVNELIKRRKRVLAKYWELAGLEPFNSNTPVTDKLTVFCQSLMDYIALGHFELYNRIENGQERRQQAISTAKTTFSVILDTTQKAVAFNDIYDTDEKARRHENLDTRLSILGEALATRIENENKLLISMMHCRRGTNPLPQKLAEKNELRA
ncbi:MAG: Rsd/AlgQ family anti-sigma factor [Gammaproteobacteria bacterium]|nr:MAG: Rsd/AlgQ family anti-sigma factor [Gammaproteobacteria bacterium]